MIRIALLWHMHQPDYRHPESGVAILPWVRLHAVKGYLDLLNVLERNDNAHCVVNFSGVLLEQLQGYADGSITDYFTELSLKPAHELTATEREFVLKHFFSGNQRTLIDVHPRYAELYAKRESLLERESLSRAAKHFSDEEITDLIVWFNLGWLGFTASRRPNVVELIAQGRHYSFAQQQQLLAIHSGIIRSILPGYKHLQDDGRIELTFTPHYHPILPLLINLAGEGHHNANDPLPEYRYPADAAEQIRRGIEWHTRTFGQPPRGVWPAEGSVSDEVLVLLASAGLSWTATDQQNLPFSEQQALSHFAPRLWQQEGSRLQMFFRDTRLADNIGFEYASWQGRLAASHFLEMVRTTAEQCPYNEPVITVTLDGENPWENYADGGESFLCSLFEEAAQADDIAFSTPSEILIDSDHSTINNVSAGSWIGGNFDIWSRHAETRIAWRRLAKAHRQLMDVCTGETLERILAAEASDWFWWYGDDFETEQALQFDELFRAHLIAAYRAAGRAVPDVLFAPIASEHRPEAISRVTGLISPKLDGRISSYFEWRGAIKLTAASGRSVMAKSSDDAITALWYGFSEDALWLRLDMADALRNAIQQHNWQLTVHISQNEHVQLLTYPAADAAAPCIDAAGDKIIEACINIEQAGLVRSKNTYLWLEITLADRTPLRFPESGCFPLYAVGTDFADEHWTV